MVFKKINTNMEDPEDATPDQDDATIPEKYDDYIGVKAFLSMVYGY